MVEVRKINTYEDFKSFINVGDGLKIVKIGAEWCGPCRVMENTIHGLNPDKINGILLGAVDIDEDGMEQVSVDYSVRNIPVLLFFKNGNMVKKEVGVVGADVIYNNIEEYK